MANLTLFDAAKNIQDKKAAAITYTYAMSTPLMAVMPWETQPTGVKKWKVIDELAYNADSAAFRGFESDYTPSKVKTSNYDQQVVIAGGEVNMDRAIKLLSPEEIQIQRRGQMYTQAHNITRSIFEGTGGNAIYGIKEYIDNEAIFASQSTSMGTVSTGALLTIDAMDEFMTTFNIIPGRTFMFCTQKVALRLNKLSRGNGSTEQNINYIPNDYGVYPQSFGGVPYIVLKDGKGTDILSTTDGDGSSSALYAVTFGEGNFTGFQQGPISYYELSDKTAIQGFSIDWLINVAPQSRKCISRLQYIKEAVS